MSTRLTMDIHSIDSLVHGVPDKPILFASLPSYQTWIKVAILLEALEVPYDLVVLAGAEELYTEWYKKIHPQQYVPALVDQVDGKRFELWDSTAIIMYICERYDKEGIWCPRAWSKSRADAGNWSFFMRVVCCGSTSYFASAFSLAINRSSFSLAPLPRYGSS
jgi:glutathione S-transferase